MDSEQAKTFFHYSSVNENMTMVKIKKKILGQGNLFVR